MAEHDRVGSPMREYLRPEVERAAVVDALRGLGLDAPVSVIELFGWHDGVDTEAWRRRRGVGGVELFRGGYFGELESAVACCREYRDVDADVSSHSSGVVPRQDLWRDSWFPFLFGDGYCCAIECDRSDPAAIWRQWFHPEPTLRVYDDLEQLLETVLGEFRRDRYVWSWELNRLEDQLDRPLL